MHHFSKWFARKKILFAWFGLKNVLCNPEELVEHVKICNSELSLYRDHFFFLLHHSKKWTLALSGNSAAMFGTFVYSLHNVPFACVCYQLSLLLVNSCHGWPVDFRPVVVIVFLIVIFVNSGGAQIQLQALRHEGQAGPGQQHNAKHAELRFLPKIILL